jgi:hypothetical protein
LQVEIGKRETKREGWRRLLYLLTQKRVVAALQPEVSGLSLETPGSPEFSG